MADQLAVRMLVKMRDYLDTFSRFKNKQVVQETEAWLETEFKELESFERSQLGTSIHTATASPSSMLRLDTRC